GDGERHELLVAVAHGKNAEGLREVIRRKRLADRLPSRQPSRISVVSGGDRKILGQVDFVQDVETVRRRKDRNTVSVRAGVMPHPSQAVDRLGWFEGETQEFVRAAQIERVRAG